VGTARPALSGITETVPGVFGESIS
jgi:hypothetical protein